MKYLVLLHFVRIIHELFRFPYIVKKPIFKNTTEYRLKEWGQCNLLKYQGSPFQEIETGMAFDISIFRAVFVLTAIFFAITLRVLI